MAFEVKTARAMLAKKAALPSVFITTTYRARGVGARTFEVDQRLELDAAEARGAVKREAAADPGALAGAWACTVRVVPPRARLEGEPSMVAVELRRKAGRLRLVVSCSGLVVEGSAAPLRWEWGVHLDEKKPGRWDAAEFQGNEPTCREAMGAAWRRARVMWGEVCQLDGLQAGGKRRTDEGRSLADQVTRPAAPKAPKAPPAPPAPAAAPSAASRAPAPPKAPKAPKAPATPAPRAAPAPIWGQGWNRVDRGNLDRLWSYLTEARRLRREAPGPMLGSGGAIEAAEYVVTRAEMSQDRWGQMGTDSNAIFDATEQLRSKIDRARGELELPAFDPAA